MSFPFPRPTVLQSLRSLHACEKGADEGMNKLLIFAMVALPLLMLLIFFGGEVLSFAQQQWETVRGTNGVEMVQP
jgi:hypothetical protein